MVPGLSHFSAGAEALRILAGRSSSETAVASAVRPARHSRLRFGDGWQFDSETLRLKNPAGDDVELTMMHAEPQASRPSDAHSWNRRYPQPGRDYSSIASQAAWNHPDQTRRGVCIRGSGRECLAILVDQTAPLLLSGRPSDRITRIEIRRGSSFAKANESWQPASRTIDAGSFSL